MRNNIITIIITFNPIMWIDRCISSLIDSLVGTDILLIDNCSTDGSLELVSAKYSNVIIVKNSKNLGFGQANNIGLKYALDHDYEYVYLLNQDAWIEPNTFSKLIFAHRLFPEYGLLSPMQINANGNVDSSFDYYFLSKSRNQPMEKEGIIVKESDSNAAHWLLSRRALTVVGGFSPSFWLYGEDENYLQRVKLKGLKCGVVMNTTGVHDRENRSNMPVSLDKKFYHEHVESIVNFSNPLYSRDCKEWFKCCYSYLRSAKQYRTLLPIKYLFKFIVSTPKVLRNRQISMTEERAFI